MAEPYDYICDARNQMIIIGDARIVGTDQTGTPADGNTRTLTLNI